MPGKSRGKLYEALVERPARKEREVREALARAESERFSFEVNQEVSRIVVEAYINKQRFDAVNQWLKKALSPLFIAHARDPYALLNVLRAFHVPDRLTGRLKRRKLTDAELPDLLREYEALKEKAAKVARGKTRKFDALWEAFPELRPELCEVPGRFFPEKFATQALAGKFGCKIGTLQKALTRARKARQ